MNARSRSFLFLALLSGTMAAQSNYPPPGKMIDIGNARVHLNCMGEGRVTVMIVGAGFSFDWSLVQPEAAKFTRVCTYDPTGSVWSDPNPSPTCDGRIEEIHAVLHRAGIEGPLVLVGHSIGAAFARLYTARYPNEARGLVLVDHAGMYRPAPGLATPPPGEQSLQRLPPAARDMHRWAASRAREADPAASRQFMDGCLAEANRPTAVPHPLNNRPLIVIANSYLAASEDYQRFQRTLLALSRNSKAMVATHSGHAVPQDNPEIIIQAVREVVSAVANNAPLTPAPPAPF